MSELTNEAEAAAAHVREGLFLSARAGAAADICEHMDVLRSLASECEHVTELGMRWANGSTVAFLAAQPKTFISWDIDPAAVVSQRVLELLQITGKTSFQPRVGDTRKIILEPTDLLFIDTLHTYRQLKDELTRHADPMENKVKKYLVFHDTMTFGLQGEDGSQPGLRTAIHWFQKHHAFPVWCLVEDRENNNGLVVLRNARWKESP